MRLFQTTLQVDAALTKEMFKGLLIDWVSENDTLFNLKAIFSDTDTTGDFKIEYGTSDIEVATIIRGSATITGAHLLYRDERAKWAMDFFLIEDVDTVTVTLEVNGFPKYMGKVFIGNEHTGFIRLLLRKKLLIQTQSSFPISDNPISTNEDNIDILATMINGRNNLGLPLVFCTKIPETIAYEIGEERMAQLLCGLAHVVIEAESHHVYKIRELTAGRNPHSGYIGVYFPQRAISKIFRTIEGQTATQLEARIVEKVLEAIAQRTDERIAWADILAEKRKDREVAEFTSTFDNENERLAQQNITLRERVRELEKDLFEMQAERDHYLSVLENDKDCAGNLIAPGDVKEFFDCEQNDLIVTILEQAFTQMNAENRDYELTAALLKANKVKGDGLKILEAVRDIFKDGGQLAFKDFVQLGRVGFERVSDNTHMKFVFKKNPQYTFTLAVSPSDTRYAKNAVSDITKKLSVYKKR